MPAARSTTQHRPDAVPGSPFVQIWRRRGTARLLLSSLVARVPDSIAATGIVVLVRSATSSYPTAGLAAAAFGIGTAVSAPLTGRALDRLGQRRVLPVLAAAFGAALTVLAVTAGHLQAGGLAVLSAIAGLTRPPIEAGLRAVWPRLIPAGQLDAAYALDSTLQEFIWIGGPLLLAALLAAGSARFPLAACAIASIAGTAIYATSRSLPPARQAASAPARSPLRSSRLRVLLLAAACYGAAAGILNLALVAYAAGHGGVAWAGVLVAIWGAGSIVGGLAYGSRPWQIQVEWRAIGCLALFGAALMLLAAAPSLPVLALLMIPIGLPLSPWLGSLNASVQRAVPPAAAAEGFTWTFAVITVGIASGNALGGMIIQAASPHAAFLAAGAVSLAGAALGALWRPALRDPPASHPVTCSQASERSQ
jgi:predicted MFS family arabinose efflux permease